MYRGTTPTITINCDIDVSEFVTMWVTFRTQQLATYAPPKQVEVTKHLGDEGVDATDKVVTVSLTQADTLLLGSLSPDEDQQRDPDRQRHQGAGHRRRLFRERHGLGQRQSHGHARGRALQPDPRHHHKHRTVRRPAYETLRSSRRPEGHHDDIIKREGNKNGLYSGRGILPVFLRGKRRSDTDRRRPRSGDVKTALRGELPSSRLRIRRL